MTYSMIELTIIHNEIVQEKEMLKNWHAKWSSSLETVTFIKMSTDFANSKKTKCNIILDWEDTCAVFLCYSVD